MSKIVLSYEKIRELAYVLRDIFKYIKSWESKGFNHLIKYPQIPSVLSENLAIHELSRGLIPELKEYTFRHGEGKADLIAQEIFSDQQILIEVKATGDKSFIEVRPKDIEANYIIWFCFEHFFKVQESDEIDVYIIKDPKANGLKDGRIVKAAVLKNVNGILHERTKLVPYWSKIDL